MEAMKKWALSRENIERKERQEQPSLRPKIRRSGFAGVELNIVLMIAPFVEIIVHKP